MKLRNLLSIRKWVEYFLRMSWSRVLPSKLFIKLDFFHSHGRFPHLKHPRTFNEKMQWLKLHDRDALFTTMVDKASVKEHIAQRIGPQYVIPTLNSWKNAENIDFSKLPDQFVLKTTHDSGGVVVCKDKSTCNQEEVIRKLQRHLARNYYYRHREWPYRNITPCIIAEPYMQDGNHTTLPVYKVFNFCGQPRIIQVIQNDKTPNESIDYYDTQWNKLPLRQNFPNCAETLPKPEKLAEILELAKKLNMNRPFLRTDFYVINGQIFFSEFTFYSDAGLAPFEPKQWDDALGSLIKLPCDSQDQQQAIATDDLCQLLHQ